MSYENVRVDGTVRLENAPYANVRVDGTLRNENAPEAPVDKLYLKTPHGIINLGILVRHSFRILMSQKVY